MRRIKLVLAVAATMASSLAAASPVYAIGDHEDMPTEGLRTAISAPALGGPDTRAIEATREAPPAIGDPGIMPGYGVGTAQSAQR